MTNCDELWHRIYNQTCFCIHFSSQFLTFGHKLKKAKQLYGQNKTIGHSIKNMPHIIARLSKQVKKINKVILEAGINAVETGVHYGR